MGDEGPGTGRPNGPGRRREDDTFYNLIKNAPFGVYLIDDKFRIAEVSSGAQKVFENVRPLIGRDFDEALRTIWPPEFADEALARFRHTLATGEPYHSADTTEQRRDIDEVESYDWQIERVRLPHGAYGVVCYFYDMTARRRAEAALRESETRFRAMADDAPVIIWVTEADGACSFLNKSWCDFTGGAAEEALGFRWLEFVTPDDAPEVERAFRDAVAKRAPFRIELRLRAADGRYRWVLASARPRFGAGGAYLGHIGSGIDINDRRVAEDHRKLLVDELNHRVKNTLAVVQSIAQQTFRRGGSLEDMRKSFEGRLAALAAAHSILTRTKWESMPLREIAAEAIRTCGVPSRRIHVEGPDILLGPRGAIAMALALHELCTNAMKYGALSNESGRVELNWRTIEEESAFELRWVEAGGPPVPAPKRRGFGSKLIEQVLANDMGGEVRMAFEPDGLICVVKGASRGGAGAARA